MSNYDPKKIEAKWQKKWLEEKVFQAKDDSKKPKYYQLETFPYPSGAGLHVGHPKGYIAEDIHARYMRMQGREVLYSMGWDAFGLPTENYAIKVGRTPQEVAKENIKNFTRQVRSFGFSYDWDREVNTSSPEYYKWTQWIFIQLFKKGLAYQAMGRVNWCPKDQTVLANEQVVDGKCERCGSVIEEREMKQWFLKITDYAERLLEDLKGLDWPAPTIKRQEDWIGKSEGAEIEFKIKDSDVSITVFTTRPDTLFGATYLVLAPEHPIVSSLPAKNRKEVDAYVDTTTHKTELMRKETEKEKTGVELKGVKAINPGTKEEVPVWIADYVLGSYGTGAIMAVPAHDERDFAFAKKFDLPIKMVICPNYPEKTCPVLDEAFLGAGHLVGSGKFDGMDSQKAKKEIIKFLHATPKVQYRIRDWSVARQRYWGVPIPLIDCPKCGIVAVPESDLPVILPDDVDYRPKGMPPLASSETFMNVECPKCGGGARRVPETLDTFVDSSWYYLRYTDAHNDKEIFDKKKAKHWLPVDLYVIGAEHTVLHLLYARFISKFLNDLGYLTFKEPFLKMRHQGLIRGADGQKMSKSRGNVINPDDLIEEFGADTLRLYEMFMGPFEDGAPWDPKGILGANRFLGRFWKYADGIIAVVRQKSEKNADKKDGAQSKAVSARNILHKTIKKVGEDIESFKFNTAISSLMILLNELELSAPLSHEDLGVVIKLLHPFAPHMAQELWSLLGHETYLDFEAWPKYDPAFIKEETITLVLQVNGRVKDAVAAPAGVSESEAKAIALANEKIKAALGGTMPKRVIYVDKKLVNIVI